MRLFLADPGMPRLTTTLALICLFLNQASGQEGEVLMPPMAVLPKLSADPPVRYDRFIPVGSDSLDATVYVPPVAAPDTGGYPAMIFVHGYGGRKQWDTLSASLWASSGYVTLCYSVRGHGASSGLSTIMGAAERGDFRQIVAFVGSWPGVNPRRVGVQGGSQGGLHGLWGIADSLPLGAVSADVITPGWASDFFPNGSVRTTLAYLLQQAGVHYAPVRDILWDLLERDVHDSLKALFTTGRDLDSALLHRSEIPLLLFAKWQDHYFSAGAAIESFLRQRGTPKIYAGTGGHYSDDDPSELSYQWGLIGQWFEYFLKGTGNGILQQPRCTYATSALPTASDGSLTWSHEAVDGWPPGAMGEVTLYFQMDSLLYDRKPRLAADSVVLRNQYDGSCTFAEGYADKFSSARFLASLPQQTIAFTSPPLSADIKMVGQPHAHLFIRSDDGKFPLHAQIYEVDPSGNKVLVSRVNFTARNWVAGESGDLIVEGNAHAHTFTREHRIRVELTNIDLETRTKWGTAPFVIPLLFRSSVTIGKDSLHASSITFPLLGGAAHFVTLSSLSAIYEPSAGRVRLSWMTYAEINTDSFFVERRESGGAGFTRIGALAPQGGSTSDSTRLYCVYDSTVSAGVQWYCVRLKMGDGSFAWTDTVRVDITAAGSGEVAAPLSFALNQNYPNPFNPATRIGWDMGSGAWVTLRVYDLLGREVAVPVDVWMPAGHYTLSFDARLPGGRLAPLPSGMYLYRLQAGAFVDTKKMLLVR